MRAGVLMVAALALLLSTGCGSDGSPSSTGSTSGSSKASTSNASGKEAKSAAKSAPERGNEASAEFLGKGENGQLAKQGKESDPAEREAASEVLEESLRARADGDWEAQCDTLSAPVVKAIEETAEVSGAGKGCEKGLETQAAPAPASVRANTMTGPINALRVQGNLAFAFYHGTKGKDYVVPMENEDGEWKVGALSEQEVP